MLLDFGGDEKNFARLSYEVIRCEQMKPQKKTEDYFFPRQSRMVAAMRAEALGLGR